MISKTFFGKTNQGEKTYLYTITNEIGMAVQVTNYGASLCSVSVPDKNNVNRDVVLGYDDVSGYDNRTGAFLGATVGRNANRIANATFTMDGASFDIAIVEKGEKFSSNTAFKFNFVHAAS